MRTVYLHSDENMATVLILHVLDMRKNSVWTKKSEIPEELRSDIVDRYYNYYAPRIWNNKTFENLNIHETTTLAGLEGIDIFSKFWKYNFRKFSNGKNQKLLYFLLCISVKDIWRHCFSKTVIWTSNKIQRAKGFHLK